MSRARASQAYNYASLLVRKTIGRWKIKLFKVFWILARHFNENFNEKQFWKAKILYFLIIYDSFGNNFFATRCRMVKSIRIREFQISGIGRWKLLTSISCRFSTKLNRDMKREINENKFSPISIFGKIFDEIFNYFHSAQHFDQIIINFYKSHFVIKITFPHRRAC